MLEILFSFQFAWITVVVTGLCILFALLCTYLQKQLLTIEIGDWLLEHIYCPLAKVILLMFMAFLLFPAIVDSTGYRDLIHLFTQWDFVISMLNILFIGSLLLTFLPAINHPAIAMPLLGCIAIGLIFLHQLVIPHESEVEWIPAFTVSVRIVLLIVFGFLVIRWMTHHLRLWLDYHFNISGNKALVMDTLYLIFQLPVLLAYGHSLHTQLMVNVTD
jgi:hypothetical protein